MKKISIITVCYNETRNKINETLTSILNQDYSNIELIVVDGGSKSETIESISTYLPQISQFISEFDNGIFDAMNKGVALSTGDWLCFMNIGDTFYDERVLTDLMSQTQNSSEIVYGDVLKKKIGTVRSPLHLDKYVFYDSGICHQAMIVSRCVFNKIGLFDLNTNLYGDADWIMKAYISGIKFKHIPRLVCIYEGGGASSNYEILKNDRTSFIRKYYTKNEIILYYILSLFDRIRCRIRVKTT